MRTYLIAALVTSGLFFAAPPTYSPSAAPARTATASSSTVNLATAQKVCRKVPTAKGGRQDCLALYLRRAWSTPSTYTPSGPVLVRECLDQYRGAELRDCLTQEIG